MGNMKIIVIGLGYYGKSISVSLAKVGHEVICLDNQMTNIESVKNEVSAAFVMDASDMNALSSIPVKETDLCIVSIGENMGASVRIVALLKKLGAKRIFVRASDPIHRLIVEAFNVDKIMMPEDDSAVDFVAQLQFGPEVKNFNVTNEYGVYKFPVPKCFAGITIKDTGLKSIFGLSVITILKPEKSSNDVGLEITKIIPQDNISEDAVLRKEDIILCYGSRAGFLKLMSKVSNL